MLWLLLLLLRLLLESLLLLSEEAEDGGLLELLSELAEDAELWLLLLDSELAELGELLLLLLFRGELLELLADEKDELELDELDAPGPSLTTSYHSCRKLRMLLNAKLVKRNRYSLPPVRISSCPLS